MMALQSTDRSYFEKLYEGATDPFRNWANEYESNKRSIAMSLLSRDRYGSIFEPGCGNGGMTLELAQRCDRLLSVDWSRDALVAANLHCAGVGNVAFLELDFPKDLPSLKQPGMPCDLLMVSELLYYFSPDTLQDFFDSIPQIVKPGGEIMLIHWRGRSDDYPSDGDAVHQGFVEQKTIQVMQAFEHAQFLITSGRLI